MKLRLKQGGIVKLQNAAETIPTVIVADPMSQRISQNNHLAQIMERDAAKAEWERKVEAAEKKADERINNEDDNLASQFMFSGETGEWSRGANTNARRAKYVAEELGLDGNKAFLDSYKKDGKTGAIAFGTTLLTAPMAGEFATYGLLGGAARLAGGMAGSAVGSWGLGKVGDWADNRLGTNWMGTTGRIVGGFAGWSPGSNFAYKGALDLASKAPSIARIGATDRFIGDVAGRALGRNVSSTSFIPAQVKYYGPTMGKSYAAKTNPNLIDLDTWGRAEYDQLAKKYGYKDWREMILSDKGDYNAEYKQLIQDQIRRLQSDPQYSGKTIVVSNASLLKPNSGITFANTPVIPERSIMATRNNVRHPWESIEHGEGWWDSLQEKGTPLRIDNRFVSEIEGNKIASVPKLTPDYTQIATTYHFDPRVKVERVNPKLTTREWLGLSKGKYGSLNRFQKEALDDLEYFNNTDNYRFYWNGEKFIYSNKSNLQPGVRKLFEFDPTPKYYNFDTPFGNLKFEPSENHSIFRPKYFGTSALPSTSFGEADLYGHNRYGKIILTSPYTDAKVAGLENADSFEKTLSKDTMKRFWANADQIVPKGTYVSGDEGALPLGDQLKRDWDAMHSHGTKWFNDGTTQKVRSGSVNDLLEHLFRKYPYKTGREGLSVDSYMAILKQGNRPGHALRFSPDGFSIFNGQGVENKWLYDLHQQMLEGKIPQQQFIDAFNKWVEPYNGMRAVIKNGEVTIPHPFIRYKQGGNLKIKFSNHENN